MIQLIALIHSKASISELGRGRDKLLALLDRGAELLDGSLEESLLLLVDVANGEDVLDTVTAELDVDGEEVDLAADLLLDGSTTLRGREVNVGLDDLGLAVEGSLEDPVGELSTGLGHGEGGRASSVLGLDDLVTTELDAVDKLVALGLVVKDGGGLLLARSDTSGYPSTYDLGVALGEEGDDGVTGVAANNGDGVLGSVLGLANNRGDEGGSTDDVKGGDTEEAELVS